jgi:hypothetical protein
MFLHEGSTGGHLFPNLLLLSPSTADKVVVRIDNVAEVGSRRGREEKLGQLVKAQASFCNAKR